MTTKKKPAAVEPTTYKCGECEKTLISGKDPIISCDACDKYLCEDCFAGDRPGALEDICFSCQYAFEHALFKVLRRYFRAFVDASYTGDNE